MTRREILLCLAAALALALLLSPFASPWPDGLEKVAAYKGFLHKAEGKPVLPAPLADYAWPGIKREGVATAVAGVAGTAVVFGVACGISALATRGRK